MSEAILVVNAGSSSIKFALFPRAEPLPETPLFSGQIEGLGAKARFRATSSDGAVLADEALALDGDGTPHSQALSRLVAWLASSASAWTVAAVGHRVVHGGQSFAAPVLLDGSALETLRGLIPLAPLHQPHNLAGVEALLAALPGVPQAACFDTAFHRSAPSISQLFALPRELTDAGLRRYGFHGSSYEYIASRLPELLGDTAEGKVVVAHLGNGASMCAMERRVSVASSMGFTALDGLAMGTRCGSIDPGVLLYLMDSRGMGSKDISDLLYKRSGLLGVSGVSQDMRELLASEAPEAREAVDLFCYRAVREIGSLAAALGGLDALVFTGGIGERSSAVRAQICAGAAWLGLDLDLEANASGARVISAASSRVKALALPTNEEWVIASHAARLVA